MAKEDLKIFKKCCLYKFPVALPMGLKYSAGCASILLNSLKGYSHQAKSAHRLEYFKSPCQISRAC